ncbi:phosphoribosyltransferase family protein [Cytophagaceae bacterium ABcell3]|nr:phosphoribosyltransferase family protein [Cytophagaceae bacterium ABcell3]
MVVFKDRIEAGVKLSQELREYRNSDAIVLAVPRGGVAVGYTVATELNLPLGVVMIKKICHPSKPNSAIGSVSPYGKIINHSADVSQEYIDAETHRIRQDLKERHRFYLKGREPFDVADRTVILVDDGIETGSTLNAAVEMIKHNQPSEIILAAPVAPYHMTESFKNLVDDVLVYHVPQVFFSVKRYYEDFREISDEEAIGMLRRANSIEV